VDASATTVVLRIEAVVNASGERSDFIDVNISITDPRLLIYRR
jgi:hypothetical protein